MILSNREIDAIRLRLSNIDKAIRLGARKNYIANQVRNIRLMLSKAERREKNTLL